MKLIPFKTKPEFAFVYPRSASGTRADTPYPTRHFQRNFTAEDMPERGLSKDEMFVLDDGITVMHRTVKRKMIKKEIARVFGRNITSTKPAKKNYRPKRKNK